MSFTLSQGYGFIMGKDMQRLNPRRAVIGAIGGALVEVLGNSGASTALGIFYRLTSSTTRSPFRSQPRPTPNHRSPFTVHLSRASLTSQASALTQGSAFGCIVSK
jgi:hypothetical protein